MQIVHYFTTRKTMPNRLLWLLVAIAGLILPVPVDAVVLEYRLMGHVQWVDDEGSLLNGQVQVGDPWSVRFLIESTAPDQIPEQPNEGQYQGLYTQLSAGQYFETFPDNTELYLFNGNGDLLQIYASTINPKGWKINLKAVLTDMTGTVINNDYMPIHSIDIKQFGDRFLQLNIYNSWISVSKFAGSVDAFVIVPEPVSFTLFIIAFAFFPLSRRSPN